MSSTAIISLEMYKANHKMTKTKGLTLLSPLDKNKTANKTPCVDQHHNGQVG